MKVLVLGATGYIGNPTAIALRRAGHTVYGQTRSSDKAKQLVADEIIPIVCEPTDTSAYTPLVATLDAVIEILNGDLVNTSALVLDAVSTASQKLRPASAPKMTYIYTSGTWVHGESSVDTVTDTTPITNPVQIVDWRIDREQDVIKSQVLNGIVIRASMVYGRNAGVIEPLFWNAATEGKVAWYGRPGGRVPSVHQDDLADLFVKAMEKSSIAGGKIFDAANDCSEHVDVILAKLAKVSGAKNGYSWIEPSNLFEEALATTTLLMPYLGRTLLGWQPRMPSLADGMETYYASYKAIKKL